MACWEKTVDLKASMDDFQYSSTRDFKTNREEEAGPVISLQGFEFRSKIADSLVMCTGLSRACCRSVGVVIAPLVSRQ